jgi:hypothetical protein
VTTRYVTVTVTCGTPEFGVWCDRCMVASAVRVPLTVITPSGVSTVGAFIHCMDCGWRPQTVAEATDDIQRRIAP